MLAHVYVVCTYTYMYMFVYVYVCMYMYMYICMYMHMCMHMHMHMHVYIYMYMYMYMYMYVYVYVHVAPMSSSTSGSFILSLQDPRQKEQVIGFREICCCIILCHVIVFDKKPQQRGLGRDMSQVHRSITAFAFPPSKVLDLVPEMKHLTFEP